MLAPATDTQVYDELLLHIHRWQLAISSQVGNERDLDRIHLALDDLAYQVERALDNSKNKSRKRQT